MIKDLIKDLIDIPTPESIYKNNHKQVIDEYDRVRSEIIKMLYSGGQMCDVATSLCGDSAQELMDEFSDVGYHVEYLADGSLRVVLPWEPKEIDNNE